MTEELQQEYDTMQGYLECVIPDDNPAAIKDLLTVATAYHARLGYMFAISKRALNLKKSSEISETIIGIAKAQYLSATAQNALVSSICVEEQYNVDKVERTLRSCVRFTDTCRSLLSFEREQIRNHQ